MSKLGISPQNYEIEVPGYEGKVKLRRLTAIEMHTIAKETDGIKRARLALAYAALTPDGSQAYSVSDLTEIENDITDDVLITVAEAVLKAAGWKFAEGN